MADIFISYGREDVVLAKGLADALTSLGWGVWWDDDIRSGSPFDQVIDEQLDAASCVIVVWSTASVTSSWVRAEASAADEQGKLLTVSFERDLRLPVRFRQLNVTHLTSNELWDRDGQGVGLLSDITALTGRQPLGVDQSIGERRQRSSGANRITAGDWRLTARFPPASHDLTLHASGTVTVWGRRRKRAVTSGRWMFDATEQVLHLELAGGQGVRICPVRIVDWETPDRAEVSWIGRGQLQRVSHGHRRG